jgi:hypothetical protein
VFSASTADSMFLQKAIRCVWRDSPLNTHRWDTMSATERELRWGTDIGQYCQQNHGGVVLYALNPKARAATQENRVPNSALGLLTTIVLFALSLTVQTHRRRVR